MADIFISYAKKDRKKVEPIANVLTEQGQSVFWDRTIPGGKTWDEVIEEELDAANCVVVVWSKISIKSRWVRAEAEEGLHRNILVPVSIEDVKILLLFRPIQSVRLIHWEGDSNHPQFLKLITDLTPILGLSPLKAKEAEQLRAKEERRHKHQEERKRPENERREAEKEKQRLAEEESKQKEAEPKRKAEEEQRRKVFKAEIKPETPEPDTTTTTETKSPETRRTRKGLRFGILVGVAVLLTVGIWWWFFQPHAKEVQLELEHLNKQALNLENAIAKLEKPLQIDEFVGQRDTLSRQVGVLSEQAAKVGLESQLERL